MWDSGAAMEGCAEFARTSAQLSQPGSRHIHMTNLESRAGRPLKDALEHFADRLALDEARAFAT